MVFAIGCAPPHFDSSAPRETAPITKIRSFSRTVLAEKFVVAGHEPGTSTLAQLRKLAPTLTPPVPVNETYNSTNHTLNLDELAAKIATFQ